MIKLNENRKGYKKTKLGWIPADWEVKKLKDISTKIKGKLVKTNKEKRGIPVISANSFEKNYEEYSDDKNGIICNKQDVLILWDGSQAGKTTTNKEGILGSTVSLLKLKSNIINHLFLALYLTNIQKQIFCLREGSGIPHVAKDFMTWCIIPFPQLVEQQKIAEILSTWDEAIEKIEKLIESKQKLKQGLMQKIFSIANYKLGIKTPKKNKLKSFKNNEKGLYKCNWKIENLGLIAEIIMGQSPSSDNYNNLNKGLPLIQGNADCYERKTFPKTWTTQITKVCNVNDIIMTVRAPIGEVSKSFHKACIGRGVCAIKSNFLYMEYLYQYLIYSEKKWNSYGQGSTFTAINSNDIKKFKIIFPESKTVQITISNLLRLIDKEVELLKKKITLLKEQKKGLMQVLLTGNIRVNL